MIARRGWLAGAAAVAAGLLYRVLRRRRSRQDAAPAADPRAEELRRKLDESRTLVAEREEFESAETPVDRAEATGSHVDDRRRDVHERGRAVAEEMRGTSSSEPAT